MKREMTAAGAAMIYEASGRKPKEYEAPAMTVLQLEPCASLLEGDSDQRIRFSSDGEASNDYEAL